MTISKNQASLRILASFIVFNFITFSTLRSQTFWNVNFNNGCSSDCLASTYGGWSIINNDGGVSGGSSNSWFVSCAEEGVAVPGCGSSCVGDASLHIGADPGSGGDQGASYSETGAANATFKMAVSPTISTVGKSTITLSFDFIAYGSSACSDDRAQLRLSADNGATWPVGYQYCLTSVCCGACNGYSTGQWTTYTLALPAAFNNNPNVKIGFHWRNNGNGSGTDPSVAIDDINLYVIVLPMELIDFSARSENKKVKLNWTSANEVNSSHFEVERSLETKVFKNIGRVETKNNQQKGLSYYTLSDNLLDVATTYFRLKMVDKDGSFKYSNIISVANDASKTASLTFDNLFMTDDILKLKLNASTNLNTNINIYDLQGKNVLSQSGKKIISGVNNMALDVSKLASGVYLINIKTDNASVDITQKFYRVK